MQTTHVQPGTSIWYGQVLARPGQQPVARVLQGTVLRKAKKQGFHRVKFPHAKFGLEIPTRFLRADPTQAHVDIHARFADKINALARQIQSLRDAKTAYDLTTLVDWSRAPRTGAEQHPR